MEPLVGLAPFGGGFVAGVIDTVSPAGDVLWSRTVEDVAALLDVATDKQGAIYTVGVAGGGGTDGDGVLLKLTP